MAGDAERQNEAICGQNALDGRWRDSYPLKAAAAVSELSIGAVDLAQNCSNSATIAARSSASSPCTG